MGGLLIKRLHYGAFPIMTMVFTLYDPDEKNHPHAPQQLPKGPGVPPAAARSSAGWMVACWARCGVAPGTSVAVERCLQRP